MYKCVQKNDVIPTQEIGKLLRSILIDKQYLEERHSLIHNKHWRFSLVVLQSFTFSRLNVMNSK